MRRGFISTATHQIWIRFQSEETVIFYFDFCFLFTIFVNGFNFIFPHAILSHLIIYYFRLQINFIYIIFFCKSFKLYIVSGWYVLLILIYYVSIWFSIYLIRKSWIKNVPQCIIGWKSTFQRNPNIRQVCLSFWHKSIIKVLIES